MGNHLGRVVLIAVARLANGFFAGSEIALVSARISRLAQLRQGAATGAAKAMSLKENPEGFLPTIKIAITVVGTLASAVGGATANTAALPPRGRPWRIPRGCCEGDGREHQDPERRRLEVRVGHGDALREIAQRQSQGHEV
jgi:putative hemolysin